MSTTVQYPAGHGGGPSPAPPDPSVPAVPDRRPGMPGRLRRRVHVRTVPARIRALTVAAVVAVAALCGVASWAVDNARTGLKVIGDEAGRQVMVTGDLFFALNDMDAQVATMLLLGRDPRLGRGPNPDPDSALNRAWNRSVRLYEQRRAEASEALLQAAQLAGNDSVKQQTVREVLTGLSLYEQLVGKVRLLVSPQEQPTPVSAEQFGRALQLSQQATRLMRLELLPKAYNLTLESGSVVRRTYEGKHSSVQAGRWWVLAVGLVAVAVLVAVQWYLTRRFRRLLNPALALATLGTLALTLMTTVLLGSLATRLQTAKEDGFDSVLRLSRARAISISAYADESRYLLDERNTDTYEQVYFDKSQALLYQQAKSLTEYHDRLGSAVGEFDPDGGRKVTFLGFFGDQARQAEPGSPEARAMADVLAKYHAFQNKDRTIRSKAGSALPQEVLNERLGSSEFTRYDDALRKLAERHRDTFTTATTDGKRRLRGWNVGLPGACAAVVIVILLGVRPRLAEYR